MLRPIPSKIMRSTVTVKACTGLDRYQNQTFTEYTVKGVHIQPTNEVRKTPENTECNLRSILFADRKHSTELDWWGIFNTAHEISGDVKVVDKKGQEFTVALVDELKDDTNCFHHWEIGLV